MFVEQVSECLRPTHVRSVLADRYLKTAIVLLQNPLLIPLCFFLKTPISMVQMIRIQKYRATI
jgi:hypothetical protein